MESDSVADVKGFDRSHFNHWRGLGSQPMSGWVGTWNGFFQGSAVWLVVAA